MEAKYISISDPSRNRNTGKLQLPYILDEVLLSTPALHLKYALLRCLPKWTNTPFCHTGGREPHSLQYTNNTGKYGPTPWGANPPFPPCVSLCTSIAAICRKHNFDSITFSPRPDKASESLSVLKNIFCLMQFTRYVYYLY